MRPLAESGDVLLAISPYAVADGVRLDGSSGGQIWRMRVPGFQGITRVRAHAHDVIVGGYGGFGQVFAVAAVDVASGVRRWFYGAEMGGTVSGLSSGPDDAIVAVGNVFDPTSCNDGRAVGLDGATGSLRWSLTVRGPRRLCRAVRPCEWAVVQESRSAPRDHATGLVMRRRDRDAGSALAAIIQTPLRSAALPRDSLAPTVTVTGAQRFVVRVRTRRWYEVKVNMRSMLLLVILPISAVGRAASVS